MPDERADAPAASRTGRADRAAPALLPVAVLAGAVVVVLAALLAGPLTVRSVSAPARLAPTVPAPTLRPHALPPADPLTQIVSTAFLSALGLLLAIPLLVLLAVLIRALLQGLRRLRPRPRTAPLDGGAPVEVADVVDAPMVRRGISAAIAVLDEAREPADAVVRAWLGVQQTAEEAGVARSPAETPTEFAVRVLARSAADARAVRALLALYLRARFDDAPVTPADAAAAREALTAIGASWHAEPAGRAR